MLLAWVARCHPPALWSRMSARLSFASLCGGHGPAILIARAITTKDPSLHGRQAWGPIAVFTRRVEQREAEPRNNNWEWDSAGAGGVRSQRPSRLPPARS